MMVKPDIERLLGCRDAEVNNAASQIYAVEGSCFVVAQSSYREQASTLLARVGTR